MNLVQFSYNMWIISQISGVSFLVYTLLCVGLWSTDSWGCGPKTGGVLEGLVGVKYHCRTPIRQKNPNVRIPYFRPSKCRPLHSAARDACPLRPPSRRHCQLLIICLRHRWKTVREAYCIRVCPSVSECVSASVPPENLVNTISQQVARHRRRATAECCKRPCVCIRVKGRHFVHLVCWMSCIYSAFVYFVEIGSRPKPALLY